MKTEPENAAFPFEFKLVDQSGNPIEQHYAFGLTKREMFAAMAMQGILAGCDLTNPASGAAIEKAMKILGAKNMGELIARNSCTMADALIAALNAESK